MSANGIKPQVVSEGDVELVGPGHDDNHYISVPIKELFAIENVGDIGVCYTKLATSCHFPPVEYVE